VLHRRVERDYARAHGMPALAEFLKGTVKDTLTSLVQPPGLVPAAVLILLNLGMIAPRAKDEELGLAFRR
jgi:hypothetical protein